MQKAKWMIYVGIFIALFGILNGVFQWLPVIDMNLSWAIASVFGVGSWAVVRQEIDSAGWTTYLTIGVNVIPALLFALKVITAEAFAALTAALQFLLPETINRANVKANQLSK